MRTNFKINWKLVTWVMALILAGIGFVWKASATWNNVETTLTELQNQSVNDSSQFAQIIQRLDSLCTISERQFRWDTARTVEQEWLDEKQSEAILRLQGQIDKHLEGP